MDPETSNQTPDQTPNKITDQTTDQTPKQTLKPRPAVTLTVESWATPLVGVLMLLVGLVAGYFGRPLITPTAQAPAVVSGNQPAAGAETGVPEPIDAQAIDQIVSATRHFRGSEDAPITLIEFSDFQ